MLATIPSLTRDGFINNKASQVGKLFEYFLTSNYSQSNTFYGEISSIDYILAKYTDISDIKNNISDELTKLYSDYFDTVEMEVRADGGEGYSYINIYINGTMESDGKTYIINKELKYSNGEIEEFKKLLDNYYYEYIGEI